MRHRDGKTSDKPNQRVRRESQPAGNGTTEQDLARRQGDGQPDELGVTQGQNGEQGNTVNPRNAKESGKIRH